jgi:hypothetical protein
LKRIRFISLATLTVALTRDQHYRKQRCPAIGVVLPEPVQLLDRTGQLLGHVVQRDAVAIPARGMGLAVRVQR